MVEKEYSKANPSLERRNLIMHNALFFAIGFLIGALFGIVFMCLLQINRLNRKEEKDK